MIAADQAAEEFISWWWNHYSRFNGRPVAIVDFGMSEEAKAWCFKLSEGSLGFLSTGSSILGFYYSTKKFFLKRVEPSL